MIESDVSVEAFISNWLLGYSSLLGPIAGIMIVDYFIIRKQQLDVIALYQEDAYPAINWAGFIAFLVPAAFTLSAVFFGVMSWFYDYGWFTGAFSGAALYYGLSKFSPQWTYKQELENA
jgi:NCS1 family nucleobase:cation symporter-1